MPEPNSGQPQPPVQRQADLYLIAPVFVTSLAVNVYEGQVAVITFFSGIPTDAGTGLISEVGMGSFALTKTQARLLGQTLLRFSEEGTNDES